MHTQKKNRCELCIDIKNRTVFFLIFIFGVKEPYSWSLKSLKQGSVAKIVRPHEELNPPSNQDLQGSVCTQQDKFGNGIFTLKINFIRLNCGNAEKKSTKTTNCDLTSITTSKFMHALQAYTYSQPTAMWVMYLQRTTHVSHLSLLYNDLLRRESHFRPQRPPFLLVMWSKKRLRNCEWKRVTLGTIMIYQGVACANYPTKQH